MNAKSVKQEVEQKAEREQMNIVIVGHVDHGKSTVIGRLLADTGSLPRGKLEQVKERCKKNSKPFEYAFLLDALKDEQAQGITIDVARCFFNTEKRHYIIIDAPGHIEFLKNMVTGASRAEAALLVIDAREGVQENSRRHGYLLSMLGIKQVAVLVNKMDLAGYGEKEFTAIKDEFTAFLKDINVEPLCVVPVSAREGDYIAAPGNKMPWYNGKTVLEVLDSFQKEKEKEEKPFRMPVQDIYKFTQLGDDRRIIAGTVETGTASVGDDVVFLPSGKRSVIRSIEGFNEPYREQAAAGRAAGFTLAGQIYVKPGELMCRVSQSQPEVADVFKVNIFWVGKNPMIQGTRYKLKIGNTAVGVYLKEIVNIIDASTLSTEVNKNQIDRHDVAECILQTMKPVAFDAIAEIESTGRFVIVDNYEISGGGIIISPEKTGSYLEEHVRDRNRSWVRSSIEPGDRVARFNHKPKLIIITGPDIGHLQDVAKKLEEDLFASGKNVYYLGISNITRGVVSDIPFSGGEREEHIRRLGETGFILADAGGILISTIPDLDSYEYDMISVLIEPYEPLLITVGECYCNDSLISLDVSGIDSLDDIKDRITDLLYKREILLEYYL
ncbi:MAG: adenylyl-sulfate kinase [bacterium]|nr:adenylyl-sulfate kinase [bacterium]